jgi:hypothetical protein
MQNNPSASQLEAAARHYCLLKGLDADEMLKLAKPMPGLNGPIDAIPRWQALTPAILDQYRLNEAMKKIEEVV